MYRTHTCGELRADHEGKTVTLAGWVHSVRTHGTLAFLDVRDRYGITQVTAEGELSTIIGKLHKEDVIQVIGRVVKKPQPNKHLETGEIEVKATTIIVLNVAQPLPLDENATEDLRLQYRYLDIRLNGVLDNLLFRDKVIIAAREHFHQEGFLEVETPLMVKPTPEGARDYVVPSRVNKGTFYALPQSPQLYKQILMIAGVDRYFQVARCLRDEDLRADRQPEHSQLDFEMSMVHAEDIRAFVERLMRHIFKTTKGIELQQFSTFTYDEAMSRFGVDKPDLRFGLELKDVTTIAKQSDFALLKDAQAVYALPVEKEFSRKQLDDYTAIAKVYKAKGLFALKVENGIGTGSVAKNLGEHATAELLKTLGGLQNGTVFLVADKLRIAQTSLGQVRNRLGKELELTKKDEFRFAWVKDFPLFAYNEEEGRWEPEHHMFSMPKAEFVDDFETRPGEVKGDLWDLVLNGTEMASGSIRVSNPQLQERIMNFIGLSKEEAHAKFGFLLEAYQYGGPVHGGMGIGADRLITLMLGFDDIRTVIAFPKNKSAQCPMDGSPASIGDAQMDELHIRLK